MRCLIVDDNADFLAAARATLDGSELTVVGEAATAAEALQRAEELDPDLVLLDVDLGGESGFTVARQLGGRAGHPKPKVILISAHPKEDFADLVAASPVLGFVGKSELSSAAIAELVHAHDGRGG